MEQFDYNEEVKKWLKPKEQPKIGIGIIIIILIYIISKEVC